MITQGAFNKLFRGGLRKDFRDAYQEYTPTHQQYLKMGRMDGPEIEATIMAGLDQFFERGDGEAVTYEDPKMGPKVVGVDKEFALGFIITRKTVEDDKYGKANQAAKWLAKAARMTYEYRAAALLDDATTGTNFVGIDGLPLCDSTHTCLNSTSTWSNQPTTPVGFSVTGIRALLDLTQLVKSHEGHPMQVDVDTVVYNTNEISKAIQIFGSSLEPFTAENQDNDLRKRLPNIKHVIKRYTTNLTSYFLIDSKLNDAHMLIRRSVDMDDTFDFDTDAAKYKSTTRFLIWFVDPRGWFGQFPS